MKCSILSALVIFAVSNYGFAKSLNVYGDVQVTDIQPTSSFIWERENKKSPQYPIELARSQGLIILDRFSYVPFINKEIKIT
ncbi:hypothetical protein V8687_20750 [Shewanella baltica]|uniref:hypothetical protein n=1 Tax=Shewanella baltica TaxID=62322 RepID=UPI0030D47838